MELPILQVTLGVFFTTTGYRKLFKPEVRAQVFGLFDKLRVPQPARWAVISGEFAGGLGLLTGILDWWAALGLLPIMAGAYALDTWPGIRAKAAPHAASSWWISKALCNPEALLLVALLTLIFNG